MIKAEGLQILTDLLSKRWDRGIGLKKWFSILCKRKCCGRRSQHQCLWGIEYERTANDNARSRGSLRNGGIVRISRIESLPLRAPKGIGFVAHEVRDMPNTCKQSHWVFPSRVHPFWGVCGVVPRLFIMESMAFFFKTAGILHHFAYPTSPPTPYPSPEIAREYRRFGLRV